MQRITQRSKKLIVVASLSISPIVLLTGYSWYWTRCAEAAVAQAAAAIASGLTLPGLEVEPLDLAGITAALRTGYEVVGLDNIGLGFRAYEVKIRVRNGDQYNFDAHHESDGWKVACCNRFRSAALRR